jgi:hypothetical protein
MQPQALALSSKAREIIGAIGDASLRQHVDATVTSALGALTALGRVHLPQDNFEESEAAGAGEKHVELAPYVLAALGAVNNLLDSIGKTFTPPPVSAETSGDDFDFEFDLVDGPTGDSKSLGGAKKQETTTKTEREQAAETLYAMGGMLKSRVGTFAQRLRHATAQHDPWPLLAELDDNLHGLEKAVQGLLFGVLGVFKNDVRREEILPEYRSAVKDGVDLRAAVTDLGYHIGRTNAVIANATPEQLVPLVVAVADRLARFAARPEYRSLRAEDKKAVIDFRRDLHTLRYKKGGVPHQPLKTAVEGFSKFLDAMQAINHREVLVVHDRQRLSESLSRLADGLSVGSNPHAARAQLLATLDILSSVYGRHPDLDEAIRQRAAAAQVADEALPTVLSRLHALCEGALGVVG